MFFAEPELLLRTFLVAALAYAALVLLLRLSGKRTLAKWNAFDLVVTVALGSSFASVILSPDSPAAQGVLAFAALIAFQLAVTWVAVRMPRFEKAIKSRPAALLRDGKPDEAAMKRERVTLGEVRAAIRSQGIARLEEVALVVLETDGSISVIRDLGDGRPSALSDVRGFDAAS